MNTPTEFKPVLTKAALALQRKNKNIEFQALVFDESKKPTSCVTAPIGDKTESDEAQQAKRSGTKTHEPEEFDIKKARHEVLRFAINNQRVANKKKKMEAFMLKKMGIKPPKKPYKNYKELLEEKKRLKEIREERKKFHQLGKNQTGGARVKCRSRAQLEKQKKKRAPVTGIDQNYGLIKPMLKKKK